MVKIGTVGFDLVAYTAGLTKPLRVAQTQIQSFTSSVSKSFSGMAGKIAMITGGVTMGGLIAQSLRLAAAYEDTAMSFSTFLRSGEKAKALLADLKKFSDVTPFTANQTYAAARGLLAFGFAAEEILPTLQYLGDAAAGSQQDIEELVNILGKIRSKGKLQLEELNRFTERGIVIIPELAKGLRMSEQEVYKFITAGRIGFPHVVAAMKKLNSEGGLFAGAMENLSRTASGKLSTLKSAFEGIMTEVGTILIDGLNIRGIIDSMTKAVEQSRAVIISNVRAAAEFIMQAIMSVAKSMQWIWQAIEIAKTAFVGLQFVGQAALAGIVALAAAMVHVFERAIELIASSFNWLWAKTQYGMSQLMGWMYQQLSRLTEWIDTKLPASLQTGFSATAQSLADTYQQIADKQRNDIRSGAWKVNLNLGSDTATAFAGNMIQDAQVAANEFWKYANRGTGTGVGAIQQLAEPVMQSIGSAMSNAMPSLVESATKKEIDRPGALERGSAEAMRAILDTTKDKDMQQQQLYELRKHTELLRDIERSSTTLLAAGLE